MTYLSVCSGIEAATVAWRPLGWKAVAFSEIEAFPCAVLQHHYPEVPNLGDMTKFHEWTLNESIDLLAGGTPCQGFSVAGLREGLDDPRSQLSLTYVEIAARFRPRWLVWENVPGVLSSGGGRDFAEILGALTGRRVSVPAVGWQNSGVIEGIPEAYGIAWVVRDAQYFGVPQRRRRVFIVGYLGDWRRAAAVLFERFGLQGYPPPRREAGEGIAPTLASRTRGGGGLGDDFYHGGGLITSTGDTSHCLNAGGMGRQDFETETLVAHTLLGKANDSHAADLENYVVHALSGEGHDASEDGTGRGTPIIPIDMRNAMRGEKALMAGGGIGQEGDPAFSVTSNPQAVCFNSREDTVCTGDVAGSLGSSSPQAQAIAFTQNQSGDVLTSDVMHSLGTNQNATWRNAVNVQMGFAVRRLTPRECERLQGFPDDYTLIPGKVRRRLFEDDLAYLRANYPTMTMDEAVKLAADGPRYKALGNSWARPCAEWIGRRIEMVDRMMEEAV